MHFDFHTSPGISDLFANFNAENFADKLKQNHVEYINFTARCNMGYSYYNTKIGKKYNGLTRDILKEVLDACHKRNIGVTAYINGGLDHEMMAEHADWCRMNAHGVIYDDDRKNNFFRTCCYNSGYGEHLIGEIKEIAAYDIDGLFVDCMVDRVCYCSNCVKDMRRKGVDDSSEDAVLEYQHSVKMNMAKKIKEVATEVSGRDLMFYFNGVPWREDLHTHAEIECLTGSKVWGYDYFYAVAPYARTRFENLLLMSGRFQIGWGDFGGIKSLCSMQEDLYSAIMNGFELSFGDHLHPVDGLENEVIERIGKVFAEKMLYEPFTEGSKNIAEIGVLAEVDSFQADPYLQGVCKMLCDLHLLYNIYNENANLSGVKLLILPKKFILTEKLRRLLSEYKNQGGKFLFFGDAINTGADFGVLDFIQIKGKDDSDNAYFTFGDSGMRWAMYYPALIIKNISGKEISRYVGKRFNMLFDGRQELFYRPQGEITEFSAAVLGENSGCVCFDVSKAYLDCFLPETRFLVKNLIDGLLPIKFVECKDIPIYAQIAVAKKKEDLIVHVKADYPEIKMGRGIIEAHTYLKSTEISVEGEYGVRMLPYLEPVEGRIENGRTVFKTGDFSGYKSFLLTKPVSDPL